MLMMILISGVESEGNKARRLAGGVQSQGPVFPAMLSGS